MVLSLPLVLLIPGFPQNGMVDTIVRHCSGKHLQTIVASHGPCHYLIVQDCSKMVVLVDASTRSVHVSDCSMVCSCTTLQTISLDMAFLYQVSAARLMLSAFWDAIWNL